MSTRPLWPALRREPLCGTWNRAKGTGTQAELIANLKDCGQLTAWGGSEHHTHGEEIKPRWLWDRIWYHGRTRTLRHIF